jgi:hypothetical protein
VSGGEGHLARGGAAARPRRGWLWAAVAGCGALAVLVGFVIRAGAHGGGPVVAMTGGAGALLGLFIVAEVVSVLQTVQAREAAAAALAALPAGFSVSGRVRVRGAGRRPAVADHVIRCPDGRVLAVVVDGSTRPPRPGDPREGLGRLVEAARQAAEAVQRAAAAGVLPPELRVRPGARVQPAILVARRPLAPGRREGVLAFAAADALRVLAGD